MPTKCIVIQAGDNQKTNFVYVQNISALNDKMLVLDIIFGRGLETAGSSCFPHGNTLQAVKSRWKRSAWREWSALHAANPRICGCELLTLCYELFALSRHPPNPAEAFLTGTGHAQCQLNLFRKCLWAICWFSLRGLFIPFAPWNPENRVVPSPAAGHSSCDVSGKIVSRHLSTRGEKWFLCLHSVPSSVTPWKLASGDAAVQSAPSWAAGLKPPSNSIKGALGQKEMVVEFRRGLSTPRHSVHGFGRALCISSNA